MSATTLKPRSYKRWAVRVQRWYYGESAGPFLAGRFYDPLHRQGPAREDSPEILTFDTRRAARAACTRIRTKGHVSRTRTTAVPVRVRVTFAEVREAGIYTRSEP